MIRLQKPALSHCQVSDNPCVSRSTLGFSSLRLVLPGQLLVEVKRSLLLAALEEGARDFPAQAACVGFQEHRGVEDAEEQPHDEQHGRVGRRRGADPAVGRAEDQIMVVASFKVLKWQFFVRKL